jgi:hypothetical protein
MSPLNYPYRTTHCQICGCEVPAANLHEHLLADGRLLRIIKSVHTDWKREDCEGYLRSISGTKEEARLVAREDRVEPHPQIFTP